MTRQDSKRVSFAIFVIRRRYIKYT